MPQCAAPLADHLITPQNAALLLIAYQPAQLAAVHSIDHVLLVKNAVSTVKTIKTFGVPIVHSTVNVASDAIDMGYDSVLVYTFPAGTTPQRHEWGSAQRIFSVVHALSPLVHHRRDRWPPGPYCSVNA